MRGMLDFDRGDRNGVGYAVVKGLGSGERAVAGGFGLPTKTKLLGLGFG